MEGAEGVGGWGAEVAEGMEGVERVEELEGVERVEGLEGVEGVGGGCGGRGGRGAGRGSGGSGGSGLVQATAGSYFKWAVVLAWSLQFLEKYGATEQVPCGSTDLTEHCRTYYFFVAQNTIMSIKILCYSVVLGSGGAGLCSMEQYFVASSGICGTEQYFTFPRLCWAVVLGWSLQLLEEYGTKYRNNSCLLRRLTWVLHSAIPLLQSTAAYDSVWNLWYWNNTL